MSCIGMRTVDIFRILLLVFTNAVLLPVGAGQLESTGDRLIGWAGEKHHEIDTSCHIMENTELAGDVVLWGDTNKVDDAANCCSMCSKFDPGKGKPCNVWVWCSDQSKCGTRYQSCWLKHQILYKELAPGMMGQGPGVMWTSGTISRFTPVPEAKDIPGLVVHPITEGQVGSGPTRARECGSPAIDGYAHVDPKCLEASRTAKDHARLAAEGVKLQVHMETAADYDGLAVVWGLGFKQPSGAACGAACLEHKPPGSRGGIFGNLPCNAFTWCPTENEFCFEADAHTHRGGDCWLKFTEVPEAVEVNQRGNMLQPGTVKNGVPFHSRHRAPPNVQWVAGVLLPPGVIPSNGTWGPRALW